MSVLVVWEGGKGREWCRECSTAHLAVVVKFGALAFAYALACGSKVLQTLLIMSRFCNLQYILSRLGFSFRRAPVESAQPCDVQASGALDIMPRRGSVTLIPFSASSLFPVNPPAGLYWSRQPGNCLGGEIRLRISSTTASMSTNTRFAEKRIVEKPFDASVLSRYASALAFAGLS